MVDGSSPLEGHVELWLNETWRTVCNPRNSATTERMRVVCRQLGYPDVFQPLYGAPYGNGEVSFLPIEFNCIGNESNLLNCSHNTYPYSCGILSGVCQNITGECVLEEIL